MLLLKHLGIRKEISNMVVIIEKSICKDCKWIESCQRLSRVNIQDTRGDKFTVIIEECGVKNIDRSYKKL